MPGYLTVNGIGEGTGRSIETSLSMAAAASKPQRDSRSNQMYKKLYIFAIPVMILIITTAGLGQSEMRTDEMFKAMVKTEPTVCDDTPLIFTPGEKLFEVDGNRVPDIIKSLTSGNIRFEKTRVFSYGQQIENPALVAGFEPKKARFSPEAKTVVVIGVVNGIEALQDIRVVDLGNDAYGIVSDYYLDGPQADTTIGRGMPFDIPSDFESKDREPEAAISAMSISSWTGANVPASGVSNGRVAMSCGATWNGGFAINDSTGIFPITINGSGFGTSWGTVTIAGRTAKILSWSNTRIVIDPTMPWTSSPVCAVVRITTAAGAVLNTGLDVVPAIRTRLFGQCTHHVARTRLQNGLNPSPSAYGGYSSINASYVPRKNDQYQWGGGAHTGIATNVTGPVSSSGGYRTWTITIGEQNADCRNGIRSYTATFQTRTVNGVTTVTVFPRSSGGYAAATLYFR